MTGRLGRAAWRATLVGLALAVPALFGANAARAQLAEKPSLFTAKRRGMPMQGAEPAASAALRGPGYVDRVRSMAEFRRIARVYAAGSAEPIVHTIFVIDRADADRVYLVDTHRFGLHEDFVRAMHLVPPFDDKTLRDWYRLPDRRFLFGTVGWQPQLKRFTFEFWEGDQTTATLIALAQRRLAATVHEPPVFKANGLQHEAVAAAAGIPAVTETQLLAGRRFIALNAGTARGRLRLIDRLDDEPDDLQPDDIVVLREVPLSLPPVAGVVTERPSTVLSHVNLLVKGWDVPNAYVHDAFAVLRPHDGHWVELRVSNDRYTVTPLTVRPPPRALPKATVVAAPDLRPHALLPLPDIAAEGARACGSKAVNLSRIERMRRADPAPRAGAIAPVPDAFCIPFAEHAAFFATPAARARTAQAFATPGFDRSRRVRRLALERLRVDLQAMPVDAATSARWVGRWRAQLGGRSVFVRSSSNAEDLKGFSGAGLYATVPNAVTDDALVAAVKTVWVSVHHAEAHEARRAAGLREDQVAMGVLVQVAIDPVAAGVMVTRDPFDATHAGATYVSAKRGLGIKVVDGKRVAEQSMHDAWTDAVRRLSRSAEVSELKLDGQGGVVDRPLDADAPRDVLGESTVRQLAAVGRRLKALFGGVDQDVEWAIDATGRVVVLQSRPFVQPGVR